MAEYRSNLDYSTRSAVVGVFHDRDAAERAVKALHSAGFRDDQIGFAARNDSATATHAAHRDHDGSGAATGAVTGGLLGAVLGAGAALLLPGVGPIVAGGILASALGGAAIGAAAGGIIGALTDMGVPEEEARYYDEQFRSGNIVVTVKSGNRSQEAWDILRRHGAMDYSGRNAKAEAGTPRYAATDVASREVRDKGTIRVPEVKERLDVEKRQVQAGEVRVHKTVEEERVTVPVELAHEEVHVERRDVERPVAAGEDAFKEGTIRVPVHAEEAVARKEAVVTGEVVVNKERTTQTEQIADTVRRTEVHVDNAGETVHPTGGTTETDTTVETRRTR